MTSKTKQASQQFMSIVIGGKSLQCLIRIKSVKYIYFRLTHDKVLTVTLPKRLSPNIESIIQSRSNWILRQISKVEKCKKVVTENQVYYLGKLHSLEIKVIEKESPHVCLYDGKFVFYLKKPKDLNKMMDTFLKQETMIYVNKIIPGLIQQLDLSPNELVYRKMKKWGCCTSKGKIVLNSYLICLPIELIGYIVCHELIHLLHFDHSSQFHKALVNFLPDAKRLEKDLKLYCK